MRNVVRNAAIAVRLAALRKTKGTAAPMSVMKRVSLIFKAKANKALDRMEDTRETLDYAYQQQLEKLTQVRRGVADVATSRKRVELQMNQLQQEVGKRDDQARRALSQGREDLAREALARKSATQGQLNQLQAQYAQLQSEEEKLTMFSQRMQAQVDAFRTRKETIKATYTAAEAQVRINEALSGISEEMGDIGMAIQRAEDKTAQMQARAGAIDDLLASGGLEDHLGGPRDDIQAELDRMGTSSDIELELAKMKGELTGGPQRQIEGSANGDSAQSAQSQPAQSQSAQSQPVQPQPTQPGPSYPPARDDQQGAGEGA